MRKKQIVARQRLAQALLCLVMIRGLPGCSRTEGDGRQDAVSPSYDGGSVMSDGGAPGDAGGETGDSGVPHCSPGRALTDRPDDRVGHQVHVVYAVPADKPDAELDRIGVIASSVAAWDAWMSTALDRGRVQGRRLRIDRCQGEIDVSFLRLRHSDAELAALGSGAVDELQRELMSAGFDDPRKTYAIYYGGTNPSVCGSSAIGSRYGAIYLEASCRASLATPGGPAGYWEHAMLHEVLHADGVVPACAPHESSGHVSDDPRDLMYAGPEPWVPDQLDVNFDDYFDHGRADCFDLGASVFIEPLPAAAQLPPGWIDVRACAGAPLPDARPTQCSATGATPASIAFVNPCAGRTATVFWITENCDEIAYGRIAPGTTLRLSTFVGHRWRARDERTGALLLDGAEAGLGREPFEIP